MTDDTLLPAGSLVRRLRDACAVEWEAYVGHPFVRQLGRGTLPEEAFRYYLRQDYVFLIHFTRAYALAIYKSETVDDMRAAARGVSTLLDSEMSLHVRYCAGWGISEVEMQATPEDSANMAYTRFVLERGMAGDVLDLWVALAPCMVGYADVARRLATDPTTRRGDNVYEPWIAQYASDGYQSVARDAVARIDRAMAARGTEARFASLAETFRRATQLEIGFWQMGLDALR